MDGNIAIVEIIKAIDGGIAVAVMLVIGLRIERAFNRQWDDLLDIIKECLDDRQRPSGPTDTH